MPTRINTENNYIRINKYHTHESNNSSADGLLESESHNFKCRCTIALAGKMDECIGSTVETVEDVGYTEETAAIAEFLPVCHAALLFCFLRAK